MAGVMERFSVAGVLCVVLAVFTALPSAHATYPRPKGATPLTQPLVPAYPQCASPNRTHGPPLSFPSCASPIPLTPNLRIGNPGDGTGAPNGMIGKMRFGAIPGMPGPPDDTDAEILGSITDVRCVERNINIYSFPCGPPNSLQENDYIGELLVSIPARTTDRWNGTTEGGGMDPATVNDFSFDFVLNCEATPPDVGSTCSALTSFDAVLPGTALDGQRAIWEFGQVRVYDGGPDGNHLTADGQALFAVTGIFIP